MKISVIICTYNPNLDIISKVLNALKQQTLPLDKWELLIVDNNSTNQFFEKILINLQSNIKLITEKKQGLTFSRLRGVRESSNDIIVFVDDDNVLEEHYLANAMSFCSENKEVGCFGGQSIPEYAGTPPDWFGDCGINLGCQTFGDSLYKSNFKSVVTCYPEKAPIGTGMVILKKAFNEYVSEVESDSTRLELGRKGNALVSGEDNDIVLTVLKKGYEVAYVPNLIVKHLIPEGRYSFSYLKRMAYESNRSWVKVLHIHNICPWPLISPVSVPFRKMKAWIKGKAWQSKLSYIKWKAACGIYQGLSELK